MEVVSSFPKLSVCIPAYNRPNELLQVLESLAGQCPGDWNVVISEDKSPLGEEIEGAVRSFSKQHPEIILLHSSNEKNLGYDGNLRRLLDKADGEYCLFMSDDDLLVSGSLERIITAVSRSNIGFVLRAWKSIEKETGKDIEEHRYFREDRLFPPGIDSAAALYRRSVFISGLTVHRETARKFHTDRFDGTLLYQLYLAGRILMEMNGYYISDIIAVRRVGGEHYFGSSETERGRFRPRQLLPNHSLAFIKGLFDIARVLDLEFCPGVFDLIRQDLGRYSYPMLEIQSRNLEKEDFYNYANQLAKLGLGNDTLFWIYYYLLKWLGPNISNTIIRLTKRLLGHTPNLTGSTGIAIN
jgi:abequosyltransferase